MTSIRRHSPPIRGRARLLPLVHPTIPRAMLAPHGLRLSWQIVRDRRAVRLRCCRSRPRSSIDRTPCLIIDDPALRPAPPSSLLTVTADPRKIEAMRRLRVSLETLEATIDPAGPGPDWTAAVPTSTRSQPMRASQRASAERRPGAMWAANQKRWRRGLRNLRNQRREREGRIRQEVRAELHDLTRPGGAA